MSEDNRKGTILYKCPYCSSGRFTKEDGWEGAVRHIKEKHLNRKKKKPEGRPNPLLDEDELCYPERRELAFAPL